MGRNIFAHKNKKENKVKPSEKNYEGKNSNTHVTSSSWCIQQPKKKGHKLTYPTNTHTHTQLTIKPKHFFSSSFFIFTLIFMPFPFERAFEMWGWVSYVGNGNS